MYIAIYIKLILSLLMNKSISTEQDMIFKTLEAQTTGNTADNTIIGTLLRKQQNYQPCIWLYSTTRLKLHAHYKNAKISKNCLFR